ncbi:hypothetical protein SprV_0301084500 [Sparganum proliferum]
MESSQRQLQLPTEWCVSAPTLFSLMFSAMLLDAYCDERPGNCVAYRMNGQFLSRRRMHFWSRVSTTTFKELLLVGDCAPNAATEGNTACGSFGIIINTAKTVVMHQRHPTLPTMHTTPTSTTPKRKPGVPSPTGAAFSLAAPNSTTRCQPSFLPAAEHRLGPSRSPPQH